MTAPDRADPIWFAQEYERRVGDSESCRPEATFLIEIAMLCDAGITRRDAEGALDAYEMARHEPDDVWAWFKAVVWRKAYERVKAAMEDRPVTACGPTETTLVDQPPRREEAS